MNIMAQEFTNENDGVLPSQTWRAQNINAVYWMRQINPDWESGNIDVKGTAFECSIFKNTDLGPTISAHARKSIGGIGFNRFIGGDADKRYPDHSFTLLQEQVKNPTETLMFGDTKDSARGSGGPGWQIQTLQPAWGNLDNYYKRHNWSLGTSWVDGHSKVMRTMSFHEANKDFQYMLFNAVR